MNWNPADAPPDVDDTSYGYMESEQVLIVWDGEIDLGHYRIVDNEPCWVRSEDAGLISPSSFYYKGRVTHWCSLEYPTIT